MSVAEGLQSALHQATGRLGYLAFAAVLVRMHGRRCQGCGSRLHGRIASSRVVLSIDASCSAWIGKLTRPSPSAGPGDLWLSPYQALALQAYPRSAPEATDCSACLWLHRTPLPSFSLPATSLVPG